MNFQKPKIIDDEKDDDNSKAKMVVEHLNNQILNELINICFKKNQQNRV